MRDNVHHFQMMNLMILMTKMKVKMNDFKLKSVAVKILVCDYDSTWLVKNMISLFIYIYPRGYPKVQGICSETVLNTPEPEL